MIRYLLHISVLLSLIVLSSMADARTEGSARDLPERSHRDKILTQKLKKNISLNDLISASGYSISDEVIVNFLGDFMSLNPSVKSISTLKKDTLVRIPLKHLKRIADSQETSVDKPAGSSLRKQFIRRKPKAAIAQPPLKIDKAMLLNNAKELFSMLGEKVTIEQEGFKFFQISEKSSLSFDAEMFPVIDLHNDRILVLDYTGSFTADMKNLLEVAWPEYHVVSVGRAFELQTLVPVLLRESGFIFQEDARMVSGGVSRIEYQSDFLVYGKADGKMRDAISLVSILSKDEHHSPPELASWFSRRDISLIELSEHEKKPWARKDAEIASLSRTRDIREFAEACISIMGYSYERNTEITLSDRKGLRYSLMADIAIDLGYRKKVIEFSDMSEAELAAAAKFGLDIVSIKQWDERKDILRRILSLLAVDYRAIQNTNSSLITPNRARYRLVMPGYLAHTLKGTFFMTDTEFDGDFLRKVIADGVTILQF